MSISEKYNFIGLLFNSLIKWISLKKNIILGVLIGEIIIKLVMFSATENFNAFYAFKY